MRDGSFLGKVAPVSTLGRQRPGPLGSLGPGGLTLVPFSVWSLARSSTPESRSPQRTVISALPTSPHPQPQPLPDLSPSSLWAGTLVHLPIV